MFDNLEMREIVGQSRTLFDRIDGPSNERLDEPPIDSSELFERWEEMFDGSEHLEARLSKDGLTRAECEAAAEAAVWPADRPLPEWVKRLDKLVDDVTSIDESEHAEIVERYPETPFVDVLSVVVEHARETLLENNDLTYLSEALVDDSTDWLLRRLTQLSVRILYVEFKTFVTVTDETLASTDPGQFEEPPTAYYEEFVRGLLDTGLKTLCLEYPVFSRLLMLRIRQWKDALLEVESRLKRDYDRLIETFSLEEPPGDVRELEPLADDTHGDGRAILRVTFESGFQVVYKPRPVGAGEAFYELLDVLDAEWSIPEFYRPTYLLREEYGWMEWIPNRECERVEDVREYYERAGALVALAYVFEFTDCHYENVVAKGACPVLVDCETLFHPYVDRRQTEMPGETAPIGSESVFLSMLLPFDIKGPVAWDGELGRAAMAGIGTDSTPVRLPETRMPQIEAVNTDVMTVVHEHPRIQPTKNFPRFEGNVCVPQDHVDAIVQGFEEAYETLADLHERDRLLGDIVDPAALRDVENRFVYRPTQRYVSIIDSLLSRDALRDGSYATVEMERLAAPFFNGEIEDDRLWPVYRVEREALGRLDPPRITSRMGATELFFDGMSIPAYASNAGFQRFTERVESLSAEDRRRQVRFVREAFESRGSPLARASPAESDDDSNRKVAADDLKGRAAALVDSVYNAASTKLGDPYGWMAIRMPDHTAGVHLMPARESLLAGRSGVALASAAVYRATGTETYRERALETVRFEDDLDLASTESNLHGATGAVSAAYALCVLSDLLEADHLRSRAVDLARSVPSPDGHDGALGIGTGACGTTLALLACFRRTGDTQVRELALEYGERVHSAFDAGDARPNDACGTQLGFHGTDGVGYTLVATGETLDESRYVEAGTELLADGWTTRQSAGRSPSQPTLSRCVAGLYNEELAVDPSTVVDASADLWEYDHLRRGNFGRVERLIEAARATDRSPAHASAVARRSFERAADGDGLVLPGHDREFPNVTFHDGLPGVAYTTLRVACPEELPCVLALE
ncbi:type 2 lanthipeptide synthetase LanM [Natronorubrum sp. DTA28]|uniref:type 2 lanthipeptide synthetase LanM n=1 Tax=Natronorubrum sp. DTA28 TaxID=3447019 RepID=UPI003F845870